MPTVADLVASIERLAPPTLAESWDNVGLLLGDLADPLRGPVVLTIDLTASVLDDPWKWKGLVLSGPFFGLALEVPKVKVVAGKIASRVYPKLGLPTGLQGKDLTHDKEKAAAYDADPLVFKSATARWFTETTKEHARVLERARNLTLPVYLTFGKDDPVASLPAAKKVFDAMGSKDKTWDPKDGLLHEVLNEPSWKELADTIAKWILAHA
jgi:alpha-beta hydrolase superfamily lysophospholipase